MSNIILERKATEEEEVVVEVEEEEVETDHIPLITNKRHSIKEKENIRKVKKKSKEKVMKGKNIEKRERERFKTRSLTIINTTMVKDPDKKE